MTAAQRFYDGCVAIVYSEQQHAMAVPTHHSQANSITPFCGKAALSQALSKAVLTATDIMQRALHQASAPTPTATTSHEAAISQLVSILPSVMSSAAYLDMTSPASAAVRRHVLSMLISLLQPGFPLLAAQTKVLECLRTLLQEGAAEQPAGIKAAWGQQVLAALGPATAALAHCTMCPPTATPATLTHASSVLATSTAGPLNALEVAVITEAVKALLAAVTAMAPKGAQAQQAVMRVLVPLLVECAAPLPPRQVSAPIRDLAIKLVTSLPMSAAGGHSEDTFTR